MPLPQLWPSAHRVHWLPLKPHAFGSTGDTQVLFWQQPGHDETPQVGFTHVPWSQTCVEVHPTHTAPLSPHANALEGMHAVPEQQPSGQFAAEQLGTSHTPLVLQMSPPPQVMHAAP